MSERVLSTRALNRALLARQRLLERARAPLPRALEQVGGIQAQYAPSMYVGLWSRLEGFSRDALTRALERRTVVQATVMRATIHLVSARDYPVLTEGVRRQRRASWLRAQPGRLDGVDMERAAATVRCALREGPRRQADLTALLEDEGFPRPAWSAVGLWVDMVRVPPSGTWERRRADLYGLAEDWLDLGEPSEEQGIELLLRRYLRGFGPATANDAASWTGIPVSTLAPFLERMRLVRFRDEEGRELLDLPRAPRPDPDTSAPVRFLPTWDATLLAHARRTQILPEGYRPRIFHTRNPQSVPTFLVDGSVAGSWRYEDGRVRLDPFERLSRARMAEIEEEAERLAAFHA
ncbi:MAG TPA: winged helix DNA-binding domain-containing protein [Actinomycetota bacterium]